MAGVRRLGARWLRAALVGTIVAAGACSATGSEEERDVPAGASTTVDRTTEANAFVTRVIDGDTVEARFRGQVLDVRLIGVDTPESVAPGQPVECYALAASRFTRRSLEGERVRLEFDVERLDRYGRTLAYVWLGPKLFNETLVRLGYAFVTTYPPNVRYVDRLRDAQREARDDERGVWGRCVDR